MKIADNALSMIKGEFTLPLQNYVTEWEEGDWEKIEEIIKQFSAKGNRGWTTRFVHDRFNESLEFDGNDFARTGFNDIGTPRSVIGCLYMKLKERKQAQTKEKIKAKIRQAFPNLPAIELVDRLFKYHWSLLIASNDYQNAILFLDKGITDEEFLEGKFDRHLVASVANMYSISVREYSLGCWSDKNLAKDNDCIISIPEGYENWEFVKKLTPNTTDFDYS